MGNRKEESFAPFKINKMRGVVNVSLKVNESRAYMIKWAVTIILSLIFFLIPEQGFYTTTVRNFFVITVFSLSVMAFEFFPVVVMAALMPMLWALFGVCTASVAMGPWMGSTMPMVLGMFVMVASLEACGLLKRLAFYLMSKIDGSYVKICFAVFFVSVIIGFLTLGVAYPIMAAICAGLCYALDIQKTKAGAGIALAGMLGACSSHAFTFTSQGMGVIRGMAGDMLAGINIDLFSVFFHNWPMVLVCCIILFIATKWYKPEKQFNSSEYFKNELAKMGTIKKSEKSNLAMLLIIIAFICTSRFHGLDMNYALAIVPFFMFLPGVDGADEEALKNVNWQMVFFVGSCMAIGTVANSLGLGDVLGKICLDVFENVGGNIFAIFTVTFGLIFVMNFLMTPMAIWSLLTVPLLTAAETLGFNLLPFVYALISCSEAIILPYEYVPYLLFYGMGIITMGDFVKLNILRSIIFFGGYLAILIPYWMLIGIV